MRKNRTEVITYINSLKTYEGYVQFSHRAIDLEKDMFPRTEDIVLENEQSFVYEAHFTDGVTSVAVRQVNAEWLVTKTNIESAELQTYHSIAGKVKMAQIWEAKEDANCAEMQVLKLQKVVFAGFEKGDRV